MAGMARLPELIGQHPGKGADDAQISIETDHGLRVAALAGADYVVDLVNPLQASRYRERD
jgi:hypothetical protein